jgi:hypothetical protein
MSRRRRIEQKKENRAEEGEQNRRIEQKNRAEEGE